MSDTITIAIETRAATAALNRIVNALANPDTILFPIGELLVESTKRRFETSTAPDGTRWDGYEHRKPLVDTGALAESITSRVANGTLYVGTDRFSDEWASGALVHQLGVDKTGINRNGKNYHVAIPARPFLGLSSDDEQGIQAIVRRFLSRAVTQ